MVRVGEVLNFIVSGFGLLISFHCCFFSRIEIMKLFYSFKCISYTLSREYKRRAECKEARVLVKE